MIETGPARFAVAAAVAGMALQPVAAAPAMEEAMEVLGAARAAVAEITLLAGTEDLDIEAFREALRTSRGEIPYAGFETAAGIIEVANTGTTTAQQLVNFNVAWSALEVNWAYATLLGDAEASSRLGRESNLLINYEVQYMANVQQGSAAFASFYTQREAHAVTLTLHSAASEMNLIALIPDAMDPERFVRQRLQVAYNRLTNAAAFVKSAGEAFAIYF